MLSEIKYMVKPSGQEVAMEVKDIKAANFIRVEFPDKTGHIDIAESVFRDGGDLKATGIVIKGSKMLHLEELSLNLCRINFKKEM